MFTATTAWETVVDTGSASIDIVLMRATKRLTAKEIIAEVRRLGLPVRKDANPHLSTLKGRGYVTNENGKWFKTTLGESRSGQ